MKMEIERRRSRGSFLNLFDWNGKSRKKLFCDSPNLPENSEQGKENVENMPKLQHNRIKLDQNGPSTSNIASWDFNCRLSVNSDEGYETKAPGLVARLMGLDSLPASTTGELSSATLFGSDSLRSTHCHESAFDSMSYYKPMDYINLPPELEKSYWDAMESRAQKVQNQPIKRFQTEILPPKSAKPIPITHNKLLSPIKSPGFIPPKKAAHIMEAAAKIIEASPRPYKKDKVSSSASSSGSLRILDLKEKLEAAPNTPMTGKPVDHSKIHPAKGKSNDRSNNLHNCTLGFEGSRDSKQNGSRHLGSKGKSVSLATQAKSNIQSRDTLILNSNRVHMKQKEQNEIKPIQSRSQKPIIQKAMQQRTSMRCKSNVLRQNNQKQNSAHNKANSTLKLLDSNKLTTQSRSSENSTAPSKTTHLCAVNANIGSKRSSRRTTDSLMEQSLSKTKNISQKKRYSSRDATEARISNNTISRYENKTIKCNITTDGSLNQDAFNMKESQDVISFTFTSPLRRSTPESYSFTQVMGTRNCINVNSLGHSDKFYPQELSLSPSGLHMMEGDALILLLEKNLEELTPRINSPPQILVTEGSSAGYRLSLQDKIPSELSTGSVEQDRSFHLNLLSEKLDSIGYYGSSSSDDLLLIKNQQLQGSEAMEEHSCSSNSETINKLGCQHSKAAAVLETPFVSGSCLDSEDRTFGSTVFSSIQDEEVFNFSPINECLPLEVGMKYSEPNQSSAPLAGNVTFKQLSGISNSMGFKRSINLELEYLKDILNNAELVAEDFVLGQTNKVVMPNLFYVLESLGNGTESDEDYSKLDRKVLFDCVSECLELRRKQNFVGSCKAWPRWVTSVERKGWLAEDLYMGILSSKNTKEAMEDELVSKDMSTGLGKWLDFDIEAFEEGLEIEWDISTFLINELVSDLLLV